MNYTKKIFESCDSKVRKYKKNYLFHCRCINVLVIEIIKRLNRSKQIFGDDVSNGFVLVFSNGNCLWKLPERKMAILPSKPTFSDWNFLERIDWMRRRRVNLFADVFGFVGKISAKKRLQTCLCFFNSSWTLQTWINSNSKYFQVANYLEKFPKISPVGVFYQPN